MDTDRKMVTILMAKKLHDVLEAFVQEHAEVALAHLGLKPDEFREYLLERAPDAIDMVRAHKSA
mgnify:FL=1